MDYYKYNNKINIVKNICNKSNIKIYKTKPLINNKIKQIKRNYYKIYLTPYYIINRLKDKYKTSSKDFYLKIINEILYNEKSLFSCSYRERLLLDDNNEFLKRFYLSKEANERLYKITSFYEINTKIFPNYISIRESKFLFENIRKKQLLICNNINDNTSKKSFNCLNTSRDLNINNNNKSFLIFSENIKNSIQNIKPYFKEESVLSISASKASLISVCNRLNIHKNDYILNKKINNKFKSQHFVNINTNSSFSLFTSKSLYLNNSILDINDNFNTKLNSKDENYLSNLSLDLAQTPRNIECNNNNNKENIIPIKNSYYTYKKKRIKSQFDNKKIKDLIQSNKANIDINKDNDILNTNLQSKENNKFGISKNYILKTPTTTASMSKNYSSNKTTETLYNNISSNANNLINYNSCTLKKKNLNNNYNFLLTKKTNTKTNDIQIYNKKSDTSDKNNDSNNLLQFKSKHHDNINFNNIETNKNYIIQNLNCEKNYIQDSFIIKSNIKTKKKNKSEIFVLKDSLKMNTEEFNKNIYIYDKQKVHNILSVDKINLETNKCLSKSNNTKKFDNNKNNIDNTNNLCNKITNNNINNIVCNVSNNIIPDSINIYSIKQNIYMSNCNNNCYNNNNSNKINTKHKNIEKELVLDNKIINYNINEKKKNINNYGNTSYKNNVLNKSKTHNIINYKL